VSELEDQIDQKLEEKLEDRYSVSADIESDYCVISVISEGELPITVLSEVDSILDENFQTFEVERADRNSRGRIL